MSRYRKDFDSRLIIFCLQISQLNFLPEYSQSEESSSVLNFFFPFQHSLFLHTILFLTTQPFFLHLKLGNVRESKQDDILRKEMEEIKGDYFSSASDALTRASWAMCSSSK